MKYSSIELGKDYETKEDLFKDLVANQHEMISIKKKQITESRNKGASLTAKPLDISKLSSESIKGFEMDSDFYYIAVNSTNILDFHNDLHIKGIWKRTTKDQQGKNYLVDTHILSIDTTIVRKEHLSIFTAVVPFSAIGKSYEGDTEVLVYKFRKDKVIHQKAKEWLDSGDAIEASVRMQYIDMLMCVNSDLKEYKVEKKNFDKYINEVANKEDFEEILYFWAIKEAKNVSESSLVLFGSNPTTGQLINGAAKALHTIEPSVDTHKRLVNYYLNN